MGAAERWDGAADHPERVPRSHAEPIQAGPDAVEHERFGVQVRATEGTVDAARERGLLQRVQHAGYRNAVRHRHCHDQEFSRRAPHSSVEYAAELVARYRPVVLGV